MNELNDDVDNKEIINNLNNSSETINAYGELISQLKNYNIIFEQINKDNL